MNEKSGVTMKREREREKKIDGNDEAEESKENNW